MSKAKKIILVLTVVLVLALIAAAFSVRIETIRFSGNKEYTDEELTQMLYPSSLDRVYFIDRIKGYLGKQQTFPFIEKIEKIYVDMHTVDIIVYEKSIIGCIQYMGSYMYFDKDGMIVESTSEKIAEVPVVQGLSFQQIVLYQKLPVRNEEVFEGILNLTQLISLYQIPSNKIKFDAFRNATLYLGDGTDDQGKPLVLSNVTVLLGSTADMEEKMAELKNQLPYLSGLSGVLHLETFDRNAVNPSYLFEKTQEPGTAETTAVETTAAEEIPENDPEEE